MKTSMKKIAAVIALTALAAGPASAMISQGDLNRDVHSAVNGGSNLFVNIDQAGVVTLSGYYADAGDQQAAVRAALQADGVVRVIDNATRSN